LIAFLRVCLLTLALLSVVAAPLSAHGAPRETDRIGELSVSDSPAEVVQAAPDVGMKAGILVAPDGRLLWGRVIDERRAMASTTKIMTAIVTLENTDDLEEQVTVTQRAARVGESEADIRAGERYTVQELLEALLVKSGNDASVALAEHVGESQDDFVRMMNEKATEPGLADTRFANPHGLDEFGHYTTADDLSALSRYAMANEEFRRIVGLEETTIDGGKGKRTLESSNLLLGRYDGASGVKTGWTGRAGYCLVATAERGGNELTAVILGADSESIRFDQAEDLLDWGFTNYTTPVLVSTSETLSALPVNDYIDVTVDAVVATDVVAPVFVPDGEVVRELKLAEGVDAPVTAGDRLGTLTITQGTRLVTQVPVVAATAVERPGFFERVQIAFTRLWRWISGAE
jgi:D-alanyl-D-alanine carboxypeptidase (penicillin-binding protein 5/6)